jgi:hypothetical protein
LFSGSRIDYGEALLEKAFVRIMKVSKSQLIEEIRQRHITSCSVCDGFVRETESLNLNAGVVLMREAVALG